MNRRGRWRQWSATSLRRPASRVAAAAAVAALALLARWPGTLWHWNFEDLEVYRTAAGRLLHGAPLQNPRDTLPFTYPPFAAVIFTPFYGAGVIAARLLMTALSLASLVVIVRTSQSNLPPSRIATPVAVIGAFCLEPVVRTLGLGQINLVLTAAVMLDAFAVPRRYRGLLTGVAAGIKLTPAVFILYFLLARDRAAAVRLIVAFGATIGVTFAVAPHAARAYWTSTFYSSDHVGGVAYIDNQSLLGVAVRLTHTQHPPTTVSAGLATVALLLAGWAAHRQLQQGEQVLALSCIGLGGLLASPISWSHHWTWLIPLTIALIAHRRWILAAGTVTLSYVAPEWFLPRGGLREFRFAWWEHLICANLALLAVGVLIALARTQSRDRRNDHAEKRMALPG